MDINRALRLALASGKVLLGGNQCRHAVEKGEAQLLIMARNCPPEMVEFSTSKKASVYRFEGTNAKLGAACGKPFPISTVTVVDPGQSDIQALKPANE